MAAYVTNRFEIYRWDADTDTYTREQMNTSHANLEDLAAKILEGVGIPEASGAGVSKTFYFDTAANVLYYYDDEWLRVTPSFGTPVSTGTANALGAATTVAKSDHVHAIGNNTLTSAKFNTSVAGAGLSVDNTAMSVNVDDSTLQINSDTLRVKNGGIQQVHTDTASRLIHMSEGTAAPVASAAVGDLNIRKGNKQLYEYTATGWVAYKIVERTPAVKVSWTAQYPTAAGDITTVARWNTASFPAATDERNLWSPTETDFDTAVLNGYFTLRIPFTGFYLFAGDAAWSNLNSDNSAANGAREVALYINAVGAPDTYVQQPGGTSANVVTSAFTRLVSTTFLPCTVGDLVQLRMRNVSLNTGNVLLEGANLTITYMSALI